MRACSSAWSSASSAVTRCSGSGRSSRPARSVPSRRSRRRRCRRQLPPLRRIARCQPCAMAATIRSIEGAVRGGRPAPVLLFPPTRSLLHDDSPHHLWVILFLVVMLWDSVQVANGRKRLFCRRATGGQRACGVVRRVCRRTVARLGGTAEAPPPRPARCQPRAPPRSREQVSVPRLFKAVIDARRNGRSPRLLQYEDRPTAASMWCCSTTALRRCFPLRIPACQPVDRGRFLSHHLTEMTPPPGRASDHGQNTLEVAFESGPVGGLQYSRVSFRRRLRAHPCGTRSQCDRPGARSSAVLNSPPRHGGRRPMSSHTFAGPAAYTTERSPHDRLHRPSPGRPSAARCDRRLGVMLALLRSAGFCAAKAAPAGEFGVRNIGATLRRVNGLNLPQSPVTTSRQQHAVRRPQAEKGWGLARARSCPGLRHLHDHLQPLYWLRASCTSFSQLGWLSLRGWWGGSRVLLAPTPRLREMAR